MTRQLLSKISIIVLALTLSACVTQHTTKMTKLDKTVLLEKFNAKFSQTGLSIGSTRHSVILNQATYYWFSKDSTLSPESKQQLAYIARLVLRVGYNDITVAGYSDNVGGLVNNKRLSATWARSVYTYLKAKGISSSKISYKGHGEFEPITSNFTEAGRRENRRVEIRIS